MKAQRFQRLITSMNWSLEKMRTFRNVRLEAVNQYTGRLYGDSFGQAKIPLNFIEQAITIYMQHLAAKRPAVMVSTKYPSLKRQSLAFEHALTDTAKSIRIERTFRRSVLNAFFGLGIIKTGDDKSVTLNWDDLKDDPVLSEIAGGEDLQFTRPYAESIDFDDFVVDFGSRTIDEARYIGHCFRITRDDLNDLVPKGRRGFIKDSPSDRDGQDRVEEIGTGGQRDPEPFDDMVECYEIYLPYEGTVVTLQRDGDIELDERDYTGPDGGNYHLLSFHDVPNNIMPIPPVNLWLHLHKLANSLMNKLSDQAERQKTLPLYDPLKNEDAARIKDAPDGEVIAANPKSVEEKRFGGPDNNNFGFLLKVQDWFSYFAGNLDLLGGLGPQSSTLGQDELMTGSASKRIQDMQSKAMDHYRDVYSSLGWYVHNDEMYDPPLSREIAPGLQESIDFSPESRLGDVIYFQTDIVPYSMTLETPQAKAQKLMSIIQSIYMPMAQQAQQQGVGVDMRKLFEKIAKLNNMEDILPEVLTYIDPQQGVGAQDDGPGMAPVTRRENVRINRPGATEAGKRDVMARQLMGAGVQGSENESLSAGGY